MPLSNKPKNILLSLALYTNIFCIYCSAIMQINNNRTWMNMKVCLLAKTSLPARYSPATMTKLAPRIFHTISIFHLLTTALEWHEPNSNTILTWTSPHMKASEWLARSRIQHSCNYIINTKVQIWGRNNIKCYDTSPRSCIKINTNLSEKFSPPK